MSSLARACALAAAATLSAAAFARTETITVWRGETAARRIHDHTVLGKVPDGISIRSGTAHKVDYLTSWCGYEYRSAADRVVWGSDAPGPKFVEVKVPADAKPGEYVCGDLVVCVIDRVLPPPREWKFYLDIWQHPWAVARWTKTKPFSKEHYAAMRPLWELLATAGAKALTMTISDMPWNKQCYDAYRSMVGHVKRADGSWKFDFSLFDEYVEFGRSCGLGPLIDCNSPCPWDHLVYWQDEKGETHSCRAVPGTPEFADYWGDFFLEFGRHMKEKGWLGDVVIGIDERPDDAKTVMDFVRARCPGVRFTLAASKPPSELGLDVELFGTCLHHVDEKYLEEARTRRAEGKITRFYFCNLPKHPNTLMSCRTSEAFWLAVYPFFSGLDGLSNWAWNSWPQNPMVDASYTGIGWGWPAGNTFLVYPDGSPSYRFLEFRTGRQCAEKLRILKEAGDPKAAEAVKRIERRYNLQDALSDKTDWFYTELLTLEAVNGQKDI